MERLGKARNVVPSGKLPKIQPRSVSFIVITTSCYRVLLKSDGYLTCSLTNFSFPPPFLICLFLQLCDLPPLPLSLASRLLTRTVRIIQANIVLFFSCSQADFITALCIIHAYQPTVYADRFCYASCSQAVQAGLDDAFKHHPGGGVTCKWCWTRRQGADKPLSHASLFMTMSGQWWSLSIHMRWCMCHTKARYEREDYCVLNPVLWICLCCLVSLCLGGLETLLSLLLAPFNCSGQE